jgi:hypothetical protein
MIIGWISLFPESNRKEKSMILKVPLKDTGIDE